VQDVREERPVLGDNRPVEPFTRRTRRSHRDWPVTENGAARLRDHVLEREHQHGQAEQDDHGLPSRRTVYRSFAAWPPRGRPLLSILGEVPLLRLITVAFGRNREGSTGRNKCARTRCQKWAARDGPGLVSVESACAPAARVLVVPRWSLRRRVRVVGTFPTRRSRRSPPARVVVRARKTHPAPTVRAASCQAAGSPQSGSSSNRVVSLLGYLIPCLRKTAATSAVGVTAARTEGEIEPTCTIPSRSRPGGAGRAQS